ncbi:hypothetical protein vBRpoPV14_06 [Ruegeria phage vB_RpoP-V14]|uniref:Uncharacterized protein n=4 Tax=Aorunvirus V12 TaxID=2846074 RepID=A0A2Z4QG78_9CAUD|nr:hypothetical protein HYP62_gp05 [Ruegeria phage vB_RpoP-V12]AWY08792.1 hypothetical protein vBRpoPV12_5 [Ruegeria phage vB_RpoP-V12]AWY08963.1 hypothetical protein vBRpoPV21_5 [Ruegeria phage vB_RpoP-V21]AWY09524.1 hypothetical protein vBRpoPV17_5 [Ruegeria phage vB_RpoP-V17]AXF42124.1 hypothetical protein vBRpoPV14_06 [Ruegeria phage vB_RpoP-V14]
MTDRQTDMKTMVSAGSRMLSAHLNNVRANVAWFESKALRKLKELK